MLKLLSKNFSHYNKKTFSKKDLSVFLRNQRLIPNLKNAQLVFGRLNTDHMFRVDYFNNKGWDVPKIIPFQNFTIHPFNSTLHYAFTCFEGMKAYRGVDNKIRLFRPRQNMNRFLKSCNRMTFPSFDTEEFLECIKQYCLVEKHWIPNQEVGSLYLRPLAISQANYLGVNKPDDCSIFVMACPVGSYFENDKIKLIVDESYVRGHPQNAAGHKIGANYGPTVNLTSRVENDGFLQTIWTYKESLIESGASNLFFVLKNKNGFEVVTHPTDGTILPGITRDTIIKLTPDKFDFKVTERDFKINEFLEKYESGELVEVFMSGTAAVISKVDMIRLRNKDYWFEQNENNNQYSKTLKDYILNIQYGHIEHDFAEIIQE